MEYNEIKLANEDQNKRKGMVLSIILHLLLLLLCFVTFVHNQDPPTEQISGVVIQLGMIDVGSQSLESSLVDVATETADETSEDAESEAENPPSTTNPQEEKEIEKSKPVTTVESKVTEDESAIVAQKAKEKAAQQKAAKEKAKQEQAAKEKAKLAKEKAKKEAKRKAEEEAKRKAAEAEAIKKAEYDAKKSKFGSLLSGGNGNTNDDGTAGDPNGDPNSKALDNLATGSGSIGNGLSDRSVEYKPEIKDDSQQTGRVVIDICINAEGKVISAKYTQKGSTSADKGLIEVAEKGVLKYRFSSSTTPKQCGSVIVDFKLK